MELRRWGLAAVALGGLLAFWTLARQASSAAFAQPVPAAKVADSKTEPEAPSENVFLRPDRSALLKLSMARQLKEERRYAEAVRALGDILEASEDYFVPSAAPSQPFQSLKGQAQAILGGLPREGRASYELQFGARARDLLDKAVASGDADKLGEVSRRFFHTQAGYEATLLLALHHLDSGSPLAAALVLKRLKEDSPVADQFEPGLSVTMAACWLRAGAPDKAKAVLNEIKKKFPQAKLQVGGRELLLSADETRLIGKVRADVADSRDAREWTMFHGAPARNASTASSGPLLSLCWRVPTTELPSVESEFEQVEREFREQDRWALPSLHPLVVQDVVLMRTVKNLLAVDFVTGKRLWEVPCDDPFESLSESQADGQSSGNAPTEFRAGLRFRMWGDATFGTLSSDGQRVFAVEDLTLETGNQWAARQMFFTNRRSNTTDPRSYNRLAAYDIRTGKLVWHAGGAPEELGLPLGGSFFLGPPLPLKGQLYVLAETIRKGEIRLVVLDAKTGAQSWTQQLAAVENEDDIDPVRRMSGVSPSYADGVLICPTSNNALVAVDLNNHSLLWGYRYANPDGAARVQQAGPFLARPTIQVDTEPGSRWTNSTAVIAEGRVLVTPTDSDQLHCLSLIEGKLLWTAPRKDDLYLACVHQGKVVLVGRRSMRAFALNPKNARREAEPAWDGRTVAFPDASSVTGEGFLSGDLYYVPLDSGEVAAVDLREGRVVHEYKSRRGMVPGNLVCYNGRIVSQRAGQVDLFFQLDALRKHVVEQLAADPKDAETLAQRGELQWNEGKLREAIDDFRKSLELAPGPNARGLLRDALSEGLRTDFAAYSKEAEALEQLIESPAQQAAYLRLMATGYEKLGQFSKALDFYVKLMDLDRQNRDLETIDKAYSVRRDRWLQMQLAALRESAPSEAKAEIDKVAQARLDAALKDGTTESLQRFLDYFGGLPAATQARKELIAKARKGQRLLQAELFLRRVERSGNREQAGAALAELAEMLREAKLADDAALCYARLEREFADVVCRDGKTGRQLAEVLPAEDAVRRMLQPTAAWPQGRIAISREQPKPGTPAVSPYGSTAVPYLGSREPFFSEVSLEVQQTPALLTARDGWGKVRWQMPLGDQLRQGGTPMTPAFWRAAPQDHLLLVMMSTRVLAIDTLASADSGSPRVLWTQDLDEAGKPTPGRRAQRRAMVPVGVVPGMRGTSQLGTVQFPTNVPSAISDQLICYQRFQHLYGVDPLTGDVLWSRDDVRPDSALFGDDQFLFVLPPDNSPAMVLRTADGKLLGTRAVPPEPDRKMPVGRNVLVWRNDADSMVLELRDPWENRAVWPAKKFAGDARMTPVDRDLAAVLEPEGRFVLVNAADGRTLVDAKIEPERSFTEFYVFRSPDSYLLVVNGQERSGQGNARPQFYQLYGMLTAHISQANVYGFSTDGKRLWDKPTSVKDQFLILNQPWRLPLLMFACGKQEPQSMGRSQQRIELQGVDKRTGKPFKPDEKFEGFGFFRLVGDPEKKTINVHLPREVVTLTFTDQPPPPTKTSEAIFKAFGKALEGSVPVPSSPAAGLVPDGVKIEITPAPRKPSQTRRAPEAKKP